MAPKKAVVVPPPTGKRDTEEEASSAAASKKARVDNQDSPIPKGLPTAIAPASASSVSSGADAAKKAKTSNEAQHAKAPAPSKDGGDAGAEPILKLATETESKAEQANFQMS